MRPSLDPARFDVEAEEARDASHATRRSVIVAVIVAAALALRLLVSVPAAAPVSARPVGWTNWDDVSRAGRQTDKPTLVLFTADWCPGCRAFESQVLARPDIARHLAERYTLLVVDLSRRDSPNQALGKQYNIAVYPTVILYNRGGGGEVARCYGLSASDFMLWLKTDGRAVKQYIE